jgi:hypothetical protein
MLRARGRFAYALLAAAALVTFLAAPGRAGTRVVRNNPGLQVVVTAHAGHNPRHNIAPSPDFFDACSEHGSNDPTCVSEVLAAIRHARRGEHMKRHAMTLPNNYTALSVAEQTFVVTNLERVDRGQPAVRGLTSKLNLLSRLAATLDKDPVITIALAKVLGLTDYRSLWANDLGPLASDYDWMYDDGYSGINSINRDCLRVHEKGCWGHRDNILQSFPKSSVLSGGAGTAHPLGASIALIVACGRGTQHYTYTWAQALAHGANGHRVTAGHVITAKKDRIR